MAQIEQISRLHDFLVFVFYVALIGIAMRRYALVLLTILGYPPTNINPFSLLRSKLTSKLLRLSQYLVVVTFVYSVVLRRAGRPQAQSSSWVTHASLGYLVAVRSWREVWAFK